MDFGLCFRGCRVSVSVKLSCIVHILSISVSFFLQVKEEMFDKEKFDDLCWMMTSKKNFRVAAESRRLSERDCFKLFCLFNLLSEDRYPLLMIPDEVKDADTGSRSEVIFKIWLITDRYVWDLILKYALSANTCKHCNTCWAGKIRTPTESQCGLKSLTVISW